MNISIRALIQAAAFLFVIAPNAQANQLRIVSEPFFPFQYLDEAGNPQGPAYLLSTAVIVRSGQYNDVEFMPWTRAYRLAQDQKNIIIFSMLRSESREHRFHWIGPVTRINPASLYSVRTRNLPTYATIQEYKKHTVCAQKDTPPYHTLIELGFEVGVNLFPSEEAVHSNARVTDIQEPIDLAWYKKLSSPKCEYSVTVPATMNARIALSGVGANNITKHIEIPEDFPKNRNLYLAVSLGSDPAVVSKLQETYKKMESSGEIKHICESYLGAGAPACKFNK